MKRFFLLITSYVCLLSSLPAQEAKLEYFSVKEGLAGNETRIPFQDAQGYLWFLNSRILHRFDGRSFQQFPNPFASKNEYPNGMHAFRDSLLLLFSNNHLLLLNPITFQKKWFSLPVEKEKEFSILHTFSTGDKKTIVILAHNQTNEGRFFYFDGQWELISLPGLPFIDLSKQLIIQQGRYGSLAVFQDDQLMIWDADGKLLEIETAIKPLEIRSSDHDSSELVIFCPRQIFTFNSVTKQIQPHPINPYLPDRYLSDIHLRSNGDMWIAGTEKQLYFYDAAAERFYNYSALVNELIPDNTDFYGIYEDRSGNFWLGTRLGLLKVHAQKHLFDTYYDQSMAACQGYCSFRGIVEDASGNIYANYYIGIAQFHPAKKQENEIFSPFHAPFGLYIEDKYLWLNTGHRVHI